MIHIFDSEVSLHSWLLWPTVRRYRRRHCTAPRRAHYTSSFEQFLPGFVLVNYWNETNILWQKQVTDSCNLQLRLISVINKFNQKWSDVYVVIWKRIGGEKPSFNSFVLNSVLCLYRTRCAYFQGQNQSFGFINLQWLILRSIKKDTTDITVIRYKYALIHFYPYSTLFFDNWLFFRFIS